MSKELIFLKLIALKKILFLFKIPIKYCCKMLISKASISRVALTLVIIIQCIIMSQIKVVKYQVYVSDHILHHRRAFDAPHTF